MRRTFFMLLWLYAITTLQISAQTWSGDCATNNDTECMPWSSSVFFNLTLGDPDCNALVEYKTRTCTDGTSTLTDYVIVNISVIDGCNGWDQNTSLFQLNRDSFREYVSLGLIHQTTQSSVVPCSTIPKPQIANVYTAACGVWLYCEYVLPAAIEYTCETGWVGPPPHTVMPNKVKSWKWQSCGQTCCRRIYSVCKETSEEAGHFSETINIDLIRKERLGDCSGEGNYAKPCEDGC